MADIESTWKEWELLGYYLYYENPDQKVWQFRCPACRGVASARSHNISVREAMTKCQNPRCLTHTNPGLKNDLQYVKLKGKGKPTLRTLSLA